MRGKFLWILGLAALLCGCDSEAMSGGWESETGLGAGAETVQLEVQSGLVQFSGESDGGQELRVDAADLEGRWADPESGTVLELSEDGEVTVQLSGEEQTVIESADWRFTGDGIALSEPVEGWQTLRIVEEDGELTLRGEEAEFVPVSGEESLITGIAQELALGETAKTALVEFTVTGIEFAEKVSAEVGSYFLPDSDGTLVPPEGMLYACVTFRVKNVSDRAIAGAELCGLVLNYDNSEDFGGARIADINGVLKLLNPTERVSLGAIIPCPTQVGEDNEVPLNIDVTLPDTEGKVTVRFVLK